MKSKGIISKSWIQLVVGLLLGVFVLSQSTVYSLKPTADLDKKEQNQSEDNRQQSVQLADAVPTIPTQINLGNQFFLLEKLPNEDSEEKDDLVFDAIIPVGKAFRILFQQIISPNAP